jgi:multiple sugar transport system permease protein
MQRKSILILLVCMALMLVLQCAAMPAAAAKKERIVFWFGASQDERAAYEAMVAEFNRTHPNIEVVPMFIPMQYVERKLLLSVVGGVPPDVVRFYAHLGGEMMSRGALEPLDDLVKRDKYDIEDCFEVSIKQNTYGGRLYGIPWVLSPEALFYNKRLFREAGLDPNHPPRDWDELKRYAVVLTKRSKDGGIERLGFNNLLNNPADFHRYLMQNGGSPLSPDLKKIRFNSNEGVEALSWMRELAVAMAGPKGARADDKNACLQAVRNIQVFTSSFVGATQDAFGLEKVAMRIDSPFRLPDLAKYFPNLDFGVAPVPRHKLALTEVVGNSLVIPRGSKHKEAAWEFIKFATSKEQEIKVCSSAGRIPARRSAANDPRFAKSDLIRTFIQQIEHGFTTPVAPGYREVSDTLADRIRSALEGEVEPKTALDQAARKGQQILDAANEDMSRYPLAPWGWTIAIGTSALALAVGGGLYYILKKTKHSRMARREAFAFFLFISPWLVGFLVLTFGAALASMLFSFCRWDVLSPARFVGFRNYISLLTDDPRFLKAIGNTAYYAAFSVPLSIIGGLLISVLLNQKLKGIRYYRTVYYLPAVVSGVATALLWQIIFHPKNGLLNKILGLFIANPPGWLQDPDWAKPAFIIMGLWSVGGAMIIYLAGLNAIPEELYEAARLDGASAWKSFRSITLPLLTPNIFYHLVVGTMAALQFFTQAYIMTLGGPKDATLFYNLYLFRSGFEWMKMGYASAMAWILFAFVLGITIFQFKSAGRWVYYESEKEE